MCLHASWMPESQCSRCTPRPRRIGPSLATVERLHDSQGIRIRDTDDILHDQETSDRFDAMLTQEGGCLIFRGPGNHRQFAVDTEHGPVLTTPTRYAYSRAGHRATTEEVVKCSCGRTGDHNGDGLCVEPSHLFAVHRSERHRRHEGEVA